MKKKGIQMNKTRCHYKAVVVIVLATTAAALLATLLVRPSGESARDKDKDVVDLFAAAAQGNLGLIESFIAEGGSPNVRRPYDASMLFYAIKGHNLSSVEFLLAHRADPFHGKQPDASDPISTGADISPMDCLNVEKAKRPDLADTLERIHVVLERACQDTMRREEKITEAIKREDMQTVVRQLKDGCVRPNIYRECGEFALRQQEDTLMLDLISYTDFAAYLFLDVHCKRTSSTGESKQRLLRLMNLANEKWKSSLYTWFKYVEGPQMAAADLNALTCGSRSLLMYACESDIFPLVKYLLELGADPLVKDKDGRRAIDYIPKESKHRDEMCRLLSR